MNGEGGCCIANYGGGEGMYGPYGLSKVDRIMLKFRPIAPKPVSAGSASGGSTTDNGDGYVKCERSKRRYVRVKKNKKDNYRRRGGERKKVKASSSPPEVVTLPLLPESPDRKLNTSCSDLDLVSPTERTKCNKNNMNSNTNSTNNNIKLAPSPVRYVSDIPDRWLSFNNHELARQPPARLPKVVSYVTVECVTDTWVDRGVLGCTDEEIMMNMEKDTCPGFVSDGEDVVVWTNKAYRDMAGAGLDNNDVAVVLVRKDTWTRWPVTYPAFTCKVRVTMSPCAPSLTLPCDVWRMEMGFYAWRLDVKAALSLGR